MLAKPSENLSPSALGVATTRFGSPETDGHKRRKEMYLNRVELIGFLAAMPKTRPQQTAEAVTTLSLATKTLYKKDGERQERTEWHRVQTWDSLGEYAAAFRKGAHICVEGELRSREYGSNGARVRTYDIVASSIINLRAGQRGDGSAATQDVQMSATEQDPILKRPPHRRPQAD
jgi:single-strand DNA-binding protein